MSETGTFAEWVILELMGHRRLAGYLTEQEIAGRGFLRLDTPADLERGAQAASQLYNPSSVYCITPTTEKIARSVASYSRPAPVQRWELPGIDEDLVAAEIVDEDEPEELSARGLYE